MFVPGMCVCVWARAHARAYTQAFLKMCGLRVGAGVNTFVILWRPKVELKVFLFFCLSYSLKHGLDIIASLMSQLALDSPPLAF